jgi:arylsulfatase A-like enzyme
MYSRTTGTLGLGGSGWCLPDEVRTIVDDFNDAGFDTVHCGFMHERLYGQMRYRHDGVAGVDESWWKCDSRLAVDKAIDWLRQRDPSKRFYINLATNETHASHFDGIFTDSRHAGREPADLCWVPPAWADTPHARERFGNWYAALRYFDRHVGRLLQAIDELGLREDTLVVYTTDHGVGGVRGKAQIYDLGVETALLMRLPGCAKGRVPHLTQNIDLRATILELCGLPTPTGMDGRTFHQLLHGQDYRPHERLFLERNFHGEWEDRQSQTFVDYFDPQRAIRTRDWHYIRHLRPAKRLQPPYAWEIRDYERIPGHGLYEALPPPSAARPAEELYCLRGDPWELHDLAGERGCRDIRDELATQLESWMHATDDPALRHVMPPPLQSELEWPIPGRRHTQKRA